MAEPVLRLRGVVKDFGDGVVTRVLHGIDLTLERGEFAALIGPSGSGKSTLLHLIGLLDRPTAGTIELGGEDTGRLDDAGLTRLRGRALGFVFQFHHLLPAFTATENVFLPAYGAAGKPDRTMRERARALLTRVGLGDRLDYFPRQLSGGQQQRVAIARALLARPALLLADEPTGNLDTRAADEVFELLREIHREEGMSVLVVTHDGRLAARCDRVIELSDGRIRGDAVVAGG